MSPYAEGTTVTPENSQAEIARLLRKYGAQGFSYGWEDDGPTQRAAISFKAHDRLIRFIVEMPPAEHFRVSPGKQRRTDAAMLKAHESEVRRRWRCLALAIKAKLEAVETGIATFEDEFLAYTVLPDGTTVGERVQEQVEAAWKAGGGFPRLMIGGTQ